MPEGARSENRLPVGLGESQSRYGSAAWQARTELNPVTARGT